jgi:hypothetical protein
MLFIHRYRETSKHNTLSGYRPVRLTTFEQHSRAPGSNENDVKNTGLRHLKFMTSYRPSESQFFNNYYNLPCLGHVRTLGNTDDAILGMRFFWTRDSVECSWIYSYSYPPEGKLGMIHACILLPKPILCCPIHRVSGSRTCVNVGSMPDLIKWTQAFEEYSRLKNFLRLDDRLACLRMGKYVLRPLPLALSMLCAFLLQLTVVAGTGNYLLGSCPTPAEVVSICAVHVWSASSSSSGGIPLLRYSTTF